MHHRELMARTLRHLPLLCSRHHRLPCITVFAAVALLAWGWLHAHAGPATVPVTRSVSPDQRQVNLFALGDWGEDSWAFADVADSMGALAQTSAPPIDATLLLGDNFYQPLGSVDDPQWSLFESGFDPVRLRMPFYALLGNHDYEWNKSHIELQYAQRHPDSRWKMPAPWYRVDLPTVDPLVTLLMLDSNHAPLGEHEFASEQLWLEAQLAQAQSSPWVVVAAHHPMFSNSHAQDNQTLEQQWGPLFQRYKVDFFLAGHDHDMQHLTMPGYQTHFIVSGGGGKSRRSLARTDRGPFSASTFGFVHLRLGEQSADVTFFDREGRPIHSFTQFSVASTASP